MNTKSLTTQPIDFQADEFFSRLTLERGQAYAEAGRATLGGTQSNGKFHQILGTCQGSEPKPYRQEVRLVMDRNGKSVLRVEGHCSCPVGHNCKHVVALLLTWNAQLCQQYAQANDSMLRQTPSPAAVAWLDALQPAADKATAANGQCIVYVLMLADASVRLFRTRRLKSGGYSKPEIFHPELHRLAWGNVPTYYQPSDLPILRLFLSLQDNVLYSYETALKLSGEEGAVLLRMMLRTGRLYLENLSASPLSHGDRLESRLSWRRDASGLQQLSLDSGQTLSLLPTSPLWYVDSTRNVMGEVRLDLPEEIATRLLAAPPLDELDALLTREQLQQIGRLHGLQLPLPEAAAPEKPASPPTAFLRLGAGRFRHAASISMVDEFAIATLWLEYPGLSQIVGEESASPLLRCSRDGQAITLLRDSQAEGDIWHLLQEHGLESYRRRLPNYERVSSAADCLLPARQDAASWLHFLNEGIPALVAAGLTVEINDDFPYHMTEADDWFVEIFDDAEAGGGDWFDLDLGVVIDGSRISLVEPIARLIGERPKLLEELRGLQDEQRVPLQLDERRILPVPARRMRAWLGPLLEFANGDEKPRLSRLHAVTLAELEALPGHWLGGERLRELGRRLRDFSGIAEVLPNPGFKTTLRPYQQSGLNWLQFLREYELGGILADDMGLGKTVQTLAHLQLEHITRRADRPSLVVAPTSLIPNWRSEALQFAPDLKVLTLHGPDRSLRFSEMADADVILTTYPLLVRDQEALLAQQYHVLVLDEAQFVKNPKAQSHQVARKLKARHRLSLTGTPLENHLGELWAQFNFLLPGLLGDIRRFAVAFRTPIEKQGDIRRQQDLAERVRPFLLRRTKEQVLTELPPKTEMERWVELADSQRDLYESLRLAFDKKLRLILAERGVAQSQIMILDALLKLRQTCCDPRLVKLTGTQAANGGTPFQLQDSAKLELLMEMLDELLEEGRHVLLFSQFTSMLALIEQELDRRGIAYAKLTGQTRDRETPINRFQNGEVNLFLISLKAGGTGLNLTAADAVIHYDPWWNPAVEEQATARAYRIGQDKPVFVYKLLTQGTVEEKILALQDRKRGLADNLLKGAGAGQHLITAEDLDVLFQPVEPS